MWGCSSNFPGIHSYADAARTYAGIKPLRGSDNLRPLERRSSTAPSQILKVGENYVIRLYKTDVVTYKPDGDVVLYCGGWSTIQTAYAMSAMSPFSVWRRSGGGMVVRMRDLSMYLIPDAGLTIRDGKPVNPVVAAIAKSRVKKEEAKKARKYFAEVPKLISVMSAVLGAENVRKTFPGTYISDCYVDPLDHEDVSNLAKESLQVDYMYDGGKTVATINPKKSIAAFWGRVYKELNLIEYYETALPLGSV